MSTHPKYHPLETDGGTRSEVSLDETDRRILDLLSADCRASFRTIARKAGISPSTLILRIRRLEREGVVTGYRAVVDLARLGYDFFALIEITIRKGALLEVQQKIASYAGVVAVYDITGQSDSMALAKCRNRHDFSRLVKKILALENVERTNTHVILNVVKEDF